MQVSGNLGEDIACFWKLKQGVFKQIPVIRIKVDLAPLSQNAPV